MDVFAIKKGMAYALNIDNFEDITKKREPYYQYCANKKLKCYAVCPECGNPIHIVNLYGAEMMQNKTRIIKTYAKHTRGKINGFSYWKPDDKEACSLYNPTPLGNTEIKHNDPYSQDLKELIEKNMVTIFRDIRKIVSINLSRNVLGPLYTSFMSSEAYTYRAVTKYNIPYAMLYYQQSITLYNQFIVASDLGNEIITKINQLSHFFQVKNTGQIVKKVREYRTINLIFTHFKDRDNEKTVVMEIYEVLNNDNIYTIFKKEIGLKSFIYS